MTFISSNTLLGAFAAASIAFAITWVVGFLVRLLNVPVQLDRETVDRLDLQNITGGRFIGSNFRYPAIGIRCAEYKGKFKLERLTQGFDYLTARAPRNSIARISFQFLNGHPSNTNYAFYFHDGSGAEVAIKNIYETQTVRLNECAQFGLKLNCDRSYTLNEDASLTVTLEGWVK